MPRGILRSLCGLVLLFLPLSSQAADIPDTSLTPLKFLVGEWKGVDAEGKVHKSVYALSSGGTVLTETLTPPRQPAHDHHVLQRRRPADVDALLLSQ